MAMDVFVKRPVVAVVLSLALLLAFKLRRRPDLPARLAVQMVGLGYAVPGAVLVVGLLLPVAWPCWPTKKAVAGLLWRWSWRALRAVCFGLQSQPGSKTSFMRMKFWSVSCWFTWPTWSWVIWFMALGKTRRVSTFRSPKPLSRSRRSRV